MAPDEIYGVKAFARLAGVTVRTLHHYEQAGLLLPHSRTARGHRRYSKHNLLRLQQILTLRYLGFALHEIRTLLEAPDYDLRQALRAQKEALEGDILRLQGRSMRSVARWLRSTRSASRTGPASVALFTRSIRASAVPG